MAAHELHSILLAQYIFQIELLDANGVHSGADIVIDTLGFESIEFIMTSTDSAGDGDFNFVAKEGDTNIFADHTNVFEGDLLGDPMIITLPNQIQQQGYIGKKRFLSANILAFNVTTGRRVGVIVVANAPKHVPFQS